jgi:hypothetical protein
MVASFLSPDMVSAGEQLVRALDDSGTRITSALWLLPPEEQSWRLIISSPEVAEKGPHAFYQKIDGVLRKRPNKVLSTSSISAVPPSNPLITLFRVALKTGQGFSNIRFTQNVINGILIPDAYVYRLN